MADQLNVSPDAIRAASERFAGVADTARRIMQDLQNTLAELGPLASKDEYGIAFDKNFSPSVDASGQLLLGVRDGMNVTTTNLQSTADLYDKANGINDDLGRKLA